MKKKVYGRGVLERVGRVTVNTTFFFSPDGYKLFNCEVLIDILCLECGFLNVRVNLFFTSSYEGDYLKTESSSKNTEYGCPEDRSNLTI